MNEIVDLKIKTMNETINRLCAEREGLRNDLKTAAELWFGEEARKNTGPLDAVLGKYREDDTDGQN